eukprot:GCRY01005644.1.p1 GENE.GCRY01005644.1~~GCRY01005644.1.p1  ORF type:complete len:202 (+),score=40.03 GCRY01005644.1:750-1355(+)
MDGSHFRMKKVHADLHPEAYYNRKSFFSLNVLACVDMNSRFFGITNGWAGSVHDARVFRHSGVFRKLEELYRGSELGGLFMLADAAYPLFPYLITPFKGSLNGRQQHFNFVHSSTRMVVERSFGILKGRFQYLKYELDHTLENCMAVIQAGFILHNLLLIDGDVSNLYEEEEADEEVVGDDGEEVDDSTGEAIRNELMAAL